MKIKVLKTVTIPGHGTLNPGDVLDVNSEHETFIRAGFIALVPVEAPNVVRQRDPVVETRDPAPAKPARQK